MNAEISQAKTDHTEKLDTIDRQIADVEARLHTLYNALETGKLELEDLAPRIKALRGQKEDLDERRFEVVESLKESTVELLEVPRVRAYVEDLRALLSKGAILEQKAFLRSFVKRIEVNHPHITLDYHILLKRQKAEPLLREVLPFAVPGSPGRTRTSDQLVNSQSLYRLSYRGKDGAIIQNLSHSSSVKS